MSKPEEVFIKKLILSKRLPKSSRQTKTPRPKKNGPQKLLAIYLKKTLFMIKKINFHHRAYSLFFHIHTPRTEPAAAGTNIPQGKKKAYFLASTMEVILKP